MSPTSYNIVPSSPTPSNNRMVLAGQAANSSAGAASFTDYASGKADNTIRRQLADLAVFAEFLCAAGVYQCPDDCPEDYDSQEERNRILKTYAEKLMTSPAAWHGVVWGIVKSFRNWMVDQGYAVGSVNVRLSTVKRYCELAMHAGTISPQDEAMIGKVKGYSRKEAKRVDERREVTRKGEKKAESVSLTKSQADQLKAQPHTPQGRRDAVIMSLLLDHGLRVGELSGLEVTHVNLKERTLRFYRSKVDKTQTHKLTEDSYTALKAWFDSGDAPALGPLLRGSRKGGRLTKAGMTERSLTDRVRVLGEEIGVSGLSAHDCRHYWATRAARQGTDPLSLQEAGGWSSLAMPRRYVEDAKIANEGVKL